MISSIPIQKKAFTVILSMVFIAGITFSAAHYHGDSHADYVETQHQVSNDHYHCVICGSAFYTDTNSQSVGYHFSYSETLIYSYNSIDHSKNFGLIHGKRAPPATV